MLRYINDLLASFKSCFKRSRTYKWFVIVIVGLLTRWDGLGVTSFIRALQLPDSAYEKLLHFFRSSAYRLKDIEDCWYDLVVRSGLPYKINGKTILLGDGTNEEKEGHFMPGVKKLFSHTADAGRHGYFPGHFFGAVSVLIGSQKQFFSLPLKMEIQDGLQAAAEWNGEETASRSTSHVVRIIENGCEAAKHFGTSLITLDRYFLTVPALTRLDELNKDEHLLDIVTRAKTNCVAFKDPDSSRKPGRPRRKGEAVKLMELFENDKDSFISTSVRTYDKDEQLKYLSRDLLWGKKLYRKLRFVLVESERGKAIFVSTDLTLSPEQIIEAYSLRFKIEIMFRDFKQQVSGFGYHFWTKAMPKFNFFKKKEEPESLENITDDEARTRVLNTIQATERFVLFSSIAMGIAQMAALNPDFAAIVRKSRYLRTESEDKVSLATVLLYLRQRFFVLLHINPGLELSRIIRLAQNDRLEAENKDSAA